MWTTHAETNDIAVSFAEQTWKWKTYLPNVPPDGTFRQGCCHLWACAAEQHHLGWLTVHHVKEELTSYRHVTLQIYIKYPLHAFPLRSCRTDRHYYASTFRSDIKTWQFCYCRHISTYDKFLSAKLCLLLKSKPIPLRWRRGIYFESVMLYVTQIDWKSDIFFF